MYEIRYGVDFEKEMRHLRVEDRALLGPLLDRILRISGAHHVTVRWMRAEEMVGKRVDVEEVTREYVEQMVRSVDVRIDDLLSTIRGQSVRLDGLEAREGKKKKHDSYGLERRIADLECQSLWIEGRLAQLKKDLAPVYDGTGDWIGVRADEECVDMIGDVWIGLRDVARYWWSAVKVNGMGTAECALIAVTLLSVFLAVRGLWLVLY